MQICYMISNRGLGGKGAGGHTYSLRTIVQALSAQFDCSVVQIGVDVSPVVAGISQQFRHVYFSGLNLIGAIRRLASLFSSQRYDLIHAFDTDSFFFGRIMAARYRLPIVLTQCGGPNPRRYFPRASSLVLFSRENEAYFRTRAKFKSSRIYLIPNRVARVEVDVDGIEQLSSTLDKNKAVFLRISRFCSKYASTMVQCTRLVQRLNSDGCPCQLLLIGAVQDQDVFEQMSEVQSDTIRLVTGENYTRNASRFLDVADFVIGTGRGFMEAASRRRVLLTPLGGARYPVLVSTENFDALAATNFSTRNALSDYDEGANYRNIVRALLDESYRLELKRQAGSFFQEHFSIDNAITKYSELYREAEYCGKRQSPDLFMHGLWCIKSFCLK